VAFGVTGQLHDFDPLHMEVMDGLAGLRRHGVGDCERGNGRLRRQRLDGGLPTRRRLMRCFAWKLPAASTSRSGIAGPPMWNS
jgi:hypothetical protein